MNDTQPVILYIASNGRSGSTLLEMILNSFKHVWTMGEIYVLPWELREKSGRCGCGSEIKQCPFWAPVTDATREILDIRGAISLFRDSYRVSGYFKPVQWINIFLRKQVGNQTLLAKFHRDHQQLFEAVRDQANLNAEENIAYLVDSSKNQYRLFWLLNCPGLNIKIIHIVKDPRAFVYSWVKRDRNGWHKLKRTVRMSIRYMFENMLIERCKARLPSDNCFFIRYEDLAANPAGCAEKIARWLAVPWDPTTVDKFRDITNHGIAGNKMRAESGGIFMDEKWKTGLGRFYENITIMITRAWARKYGYI